MDDKLQDVSGNQGQGSNTERNQQNEEVMEDVSEVQIFDNDGTNISQSESFGDSSIQEEKDLETMIKEMAETLDKELKQIKSITNAKAL